MVLNSHHLAGAVGLVVSGLAFVAPIAAAAAAEIVVTTGDDVVADDGRVSLREAVMAAETDTSVDGSTAGSGPDVIRFASDVTRVDISVAGDLSVGLTSFRVDTDVTIEGPTDRALAIRRDGAARRFAYVSSTGSLTVRNGEFNNFIVGGGSGGVSNLAGGGGGGGAGLGGVFFVRGELRLERCYFTTCMVAGGIGQRPSASSGGFSGGAGGGGLGEPGERALGGLIGSAGGGPNGGAAVASAEGGVPGLPGGDASGGGGAAGFHPAGDAPGGDGGFGGGGGGGSGWLGIAGPAPAGPGGPGGAGGFGGGGGGGGWGSPAEPGPGGVAGWGAEDGEPGGPSRAGGGGDGAAMGGVVFLDRGTLIAERCTFHANEAYARAHSFGGAIFSRSGALRLTSCTFWDNEAGTRGGSIFILNDGSAGTFEMTNCVVAGTGTLPEIEGEARGGAPVPSLGGGGFNWIRSSSGFAPEVEVRGDVELGRPRHATFPAHIAPPTGSPLIDAGTSAGLTVDARGAARVTDFDGIANVGDGADIGAVEIDTNFRLVDTSGGYDVGRSSVVDWRVTVERTGFDAVDDALLTTVVTLPPGIDLVSSNGAFSDGRLRFDFQVTSGFRRREFVFRTTRPEDPTTPLRAGAEFQLVAEQKTTDDDVVTLTPPVEVEGARLHLAKARFRAIDGGSAHSDRMTLLLERDDVPLLEDIRRATRDSDRLIEVRLNGVSIGGPARIDDNGRGLASNDEWTAEISLHPKKQAVRVLAGGTALSTILGASPDSRGVVPVKVDLLLRDREPRDDEGVTALVPYRSRKTRTTARFDDRKHRVAEGRATTEHVSMRGRESVSRIVMAGRIDAPFDAPFVLSDSLPGDAVALVIEFGSVRFDIPRSAVRSKRDKIRVDGRTIDGLRSVTIDTRRGRWKLNSDPLDRVLLYGPDEDPEQRLDCIEIALQVQTSVGLVRFDTFYEVPHDGP